MSKMSAVSSLLYALSRIPGLGFLRGIARVGYDASYMASSVQSVKSEFSKDKPEQPAAAAQGEAKEGEAKDAS